MLVLLYLYLRQNFYHKNQDVTNILEFFYYIQYLENNSDHSIVTRALSIQVSCSMATKGFSNKKKSGMQKIMIPHTRLQIPVRGSLWGPSGIGHPDAWDIGVRGVSRFISRKLLKGLEP